MRASLIIPVITLMLAITSLGVAVYNLGRADGVKFCLGSK